MNISDAKNGIIKKSHFVLQFTASMIFMGVAFSLVGCADQSPNSTATYKSTAPASEHGEGFALARSPAFMGQAGEMMPAAAAADQPAGGPNFNPAKANAGENQAEQTNAAAGRRIIYTAFVDLITENLDGFEPLLLELTKAAKGFISETNQTGASGGQRTATWKIRVPVSEYDNFLQKVRRLGEVQSVRVTSQDVTEEFVDVSARIASKKVEEERLIDLLKNAVGKLDEILKVESELARVRSEVERMEGRIRFLKDQTELTTITVSVREVKDYQPPESPTFTTEIKRVWRQSTHDLVELLKRLVLMSVSAAPFIPIYLAEFILFFWFARKVFRKIKPRVVVMLNTPYSAHRFSPSSEQPARSPEAPRGHDDARPQPRPEHGN